MRINLGPSERDIRSLSGLILLALGLFAPLTPMGRVIVDALAAVLILTATLGWCPLYALLHINTRGHRHDLHHRHRPAAPR